MTARSTRNKMRFQAQKMMDDLGRAEGHLKLIYEMGGEDSEYLNKALPNLLSLLEYMTKIIKVFREGL